MLRQREFTDEDGMRLALDLALTAAARGEVPVGAVIVQDARVLARAYNQVEMLNDGTAHAEMIALTQAAAALGDWRLVDACMYVTKEPCPMCAGAMVNCRLGTLVFGCPDPRAGAAGIAMDVTSHPGMLHRVQVRSGVLQRDCQAALQQFFRDRRRERQERSSNGETHE